MNDIRKWSRSGYGPGLAAAGLLLSVSATARAQFTSGSDGSDGAFSPVTNTVIDLSQAATGAWDTPSPVAGKGVYDPALWVVVFKYATINIPSGVTITFTNHPKNPPVVWLATGDVTIGGTVNLNGLNGSASSVFTTPGPGGFQGARTNSPGFGPGGPDRQCTVCNVANAGAGAGYGAVGAQASYSSFCGTKVAQGTAAGGVYGTNTVNGLASINPLIGGSGGGTGTVYAHGGGGGGGAILVASSGNISLTGSITANGGNGALNQWYAGGGSGGAIRLICNSIAGTGSLVAGGGASGNTNGAQCWAGGAGGVGRIRVEAYDKSALTTVGSPPFTYDQPGSVFSTVPTLTIKSIGGSTAPSDPAGNITSTDVTVVNAASFVVNIEGTNIPAGTTVSVIVRPETGNLATYTSTPLSAPDGNGIQTATATITSLPGGLRSFVQLKANF